MPARKINFTAGQVDNSKNHGNYLSQHSDREYETLLKAFLLLGERYDELKADHEEALDYIEDMIEQQIIEDEHRDWQGDLDV